jgi:hypothetical protein
VLSDYGVAYVAIGPLEAILYTSVLWALATGHLLALGAGLVVAAIVMAVLAAGSGGARPPGTQGASPQNRA